MILAAGRQERWRRGQCPKQLLRVGGETLLSRMRRQATRAGHDVFVATACDQIAAEAAGCAFVPSGRRWTAETLLSCSDRFGSDRTVVLLGDVVYSRACVDRIMSCELPIAVFRTPGEILAITFSDSDQIEAACSKAIQLANEHRREARLAHVWVQLGRAAESIMVEDWTQDFDTQEDWAGFDHSLVDDLL